MEIRRIVTIVIVVRKQGQCQRARCNYNDPDKCNRRLLVIGESCLLNRNLSMRMAICFVIACEMLIEGKGKLQSELHVCIDGMRIFTNVQHMVHPSQTRDGLKSDGLPQSET